MDDRVARSNIGRDGRGLCYTGSIHEAWNGSICNNNELVDCDLANHARSLVWHAVESVGAWHGEGDGEGLAWGVEVLLLRDKSVAKRS